MASPPKKQLKLRENKPPGSQRLLLFPISPILHHCRILKHLQSPSRTCPPLLFSCNFHSQFLALLDLLRALHFFFSLLPSPTTPSFTVTALHFCSSTKGEKKPNMH